MNDEELREIIRGLFKGEISEAELTKETLSKITEYNLTKREIKNLLRGDEDE